ncbi:MAG: CPBP family intramembrane glutamic endopeptidase [Chloroflexota bacterium]
MSSDEPPPSAGSPGPPARPGLTTFTIEGRAAPGLFVVGWLAVLSGLGLMVIGILGSSALFFYLLGPTMLTIGLVAASGNQALERRARGFAYAGPSPWLVLGAIIAAVYAVGAAVSLGLNLVVDPGSIPNPVINLVAIAIQAIVYAGVIRLAVVGSGGLSWRDMGWRRLDRDQLRHLGFGAALAIPVIAVTNLVAVVLVNALNQLPESPLPPTGTTSGLAIQLIAGAVIAPIAEEMVFRGFALSAWERTVGATGAIVRSSLMFALAHVIEARGDTFGQVLALIAIGFLTRVPVALVLGWVFVRTRSIWAPIGLHMAFNGFLLVLAEYALRNGLG